MLCANVIFLLALFLLLALLAGCMRTDGEAPEQATRSSRSSRETCAWTEDGTPILKVYDVEKEAVSEMDIETYVMGVLGRRDEERLAGGSAQSAGHPCRTFVLKVIETKDSKYDGADIPPMSARRRRTAMPTSTKMCALPWKRRADW